MEGIGAVFLEVIAEHVEELRGLVNHPVQTNEVGRSGALLGGFLLEARRTGLPLRVLEIGASAGLNLRWDLFRYEAGDLAWGDPSSPVRIDLELKAGRPPFDVLTQVVERRGCDRAPIDPGSAEGRLTLMSYVWPDQPARLALLRSAIDLAERVPAPVDQADGPAWLARQLDEPRQGVATIVFHSILMQFLGRSGRAGLQEEMGRAGREAREDAPLAWLRMESAGRVAEVVVFVAESDYSTGSLFHVDGGRALT